MGKKLKKVVKFGFYIEIIFFILSLLIYWALEFVLGFGIYSSMPIIIIRDWGYVFIYLFFGLGAITFICEHFSSDMWREIKKRSRHIKINLFCLSFSILIFYLSMLSQSLLQVLNDHTKFEVSNFLLELLSIFIYMSLIIAIFSGILHFVIFKAKFKQKVGSYAKRP